MKAEHCFSLQQIGNLVLCYQDCIDVQVEEEISGVMFDFFKHWKSWKMKLEHLCIPYIHHMNLVI